MFFTLLRWVGRLTAVAGVLLSVIVGLLRLQGHYFLGGFQAGTLLLAGMSLMLIACLCYLAIIEQRLNKV